MRSIVDYVMIFKGRGLKMGVFVGGGGGGGGGGGVDLDLDFKNFWDGVYNFFFCPPLEDKCKHFIPSSICWCTSSWSMWVRYSRPGGQPGGACGVSGIIAIGWAPGTTPGPGGPGYARPGGSVLVDSNLVAL